MIAAEVGSMMRMMNRCKEKDVVVGGESKRSDIVTMDLLGGCGGAVVGSKELDLDLQVPLGWEKRLDLTSEYESVCTLDKIKFALERIKKPHFSNRNPNSSSPTSSSTTTSSIKERHGRDLNDEESVSMSGEVEEGIGGGKRLQAAGCPGCLSYVLVARGNPRCPRCNSDVPFPETKKRRVELNLFRTTSASVAEIS